MPALHTRQVSAGTRHSIVLTRTNLVYAFGNGEQGQLGGSTKNQLSPQLVEGLPNLPVLYVHAGEALRNAPAEVPNTVQPHC